jgi:tetratricopeptide (TPR) repeat protein
MLLLTVRANPWQVEPRVWGAELSLDAGRTKDCEDFFLTPSGFGPTAAFYRVRARYETAARNSARAGRFSRMADLREADDAFAQGRRNEAISMARKITERNPGFSDGWLSLGVFMYESGRLKQAKACFEKLARIEPGSVLASLNLGTIAVAERRAGAARRHLAKLERTAPESLDVRLLRARVLELEGKSEEAIKEYEWILERHPDHPQAKAELQRLRGR